MCGGFVICNVLCENKYEYMKFKIKYALIIY